MKRTYNIGISCIGTRGGQSIVNSCRLSRLPIKTIGFGTNPFAYGAYDCDIYDYTPSIYSDNYIDDIIKKCCEHKIDLFIPMLEDELLLLAKNSEKLKKAGVNVIIAGVDMVSICGDKERTWLEFNDIADVFVNSFNVKTIKEDIASAKVVFPFIAKPRGGSGSEGVEIIGSEDDLCKIDEGHIIQKLAVPQKSDPNYEHFMKKISMNKNPQISVISIQVVVGKNGELLGRMASYNKLNNGVAIEIVPYENEKVWDAIDKLMPRFLELGFRGPINIEGIMTDSGLKLFDLNPRFTDVSGLRALMGFNEVEACIINWLDIHNEKISLKINKDRFGIRQFTSKAVSIDRNQEVRSFSKIVNGRILKEKKVVLVTGAGGYLGQNLIKSLYKEDEFEIYAFSREKSKIKGLFDCYNISLFDNKDLESGKLSLGNIDILLHLGFAGPHSGSDQIADSIRFTGELFTRAAHNQVPAIVNISSQDVYGQSSTSYRTEGTRIAPETVYAQAKYSTEVMIENLGRVNNQLRFTSIRLCALAGGQNGIVPNELVAIFSKQLLRGEAIKRVGEKYDLERLDVRDAVSALISLIKSDPLKWNTVYNLGSGRNYTISEVAHRVTERVKSVNNIRTMIEMKSDDSQLNSGLDCSLFMNDFNWKPKHDMDSIVESLVDHLTTYL